MNQPRYYLAVIALLSIVVIALSTSIAVIKMNMDGGKSSSQTADTAGVGNSYFILFTDFCIFAYSNVVQMTLLM